MKIVFFNFYSKFARASWRSHFAEFHSCFIAEALRQVAFCVFCVVVDSWALFSAFICVKPWLIFIANNFKMNFTVPGAVEFTKIDALPGAQYQATIIDNQGF